MVMGFRLDAVTAVLSGLIMMQDSFKLMSKHEAGPTAASMALAEKVQPWKAFMGEPEVRPFPADEKAAKTHLRLKSEKDEHGLGG